MTILPVTSADIVRLISDKKNNNLLFFAMKNHVLYIIDTSKCGEKIGNYIGGAKQLKKQYGNSVYLLVENAVKNKEIEVVHFIFFPILIKLSYLNSLSAEWYRIVQD